MDDSRTELERVVRRWRDLPADHALECLPRMQALTQGLADRVRTAGGQQPVPVPDLGPAAALDQLIVMVHDVRRAGLDRDPGAEDGIELAAELAQLRRAL